MTVLTVSALLVLVLLAWAVVVLSRRSRPRPSDQSHTPGVDPSAAAGSGHRAADRQGLGPF